MKKLDKSKDIYEESNIFIINAPSEVYNKKDEEYKIKSYQHLTNVLGIGHLEFFTITALIGKFIVKERKKIEGSTETLFRFEDGKHKDETQILIALAVNEVHTPYILKDYKAMSTIWQEYSYSGFEKLYEWYEDETIDFETKLSEVIMNMADKNELFEIDNFDIYD